MTVQSEATEALVQLGDLAWRDMDRAQNEKEAEREAAQREEWAEQRAPLIAAIKAALPEVLHGAIVTRHAPLLAMRAPIGEREYNPVGISLPDCVPVWAYWHDRKAVYFPAMPLVTWSESDGAWYISGLNDFPVRTEYEVSGRSPRSVAPLYDLSIAVYIARKRLSVVESTREEARRRNAAGERPSVPDDDPVARWLTYAEEQARSISGHERAQTAALMALAYIVRNNAK